MSVAILGTTTAAQANDIGMEGCTPGYWKNHTDNWQETSPGVLFGTLYVDARANVVGETLLETLQGGGGPPVPTRPRRSWLVPATAAWLNAAHEGLGYPRRREAGGLDGRPKLVPTVNAAFASGDRARCWPWPRVWTTTTTWGVRSTER